MEFRIKLTSSLCSLKLDTREWHSMLVVCLAEWSTDILELEMLQLSRVFVNDVSEEGIGGELFRICGGS